MITLRDVILSSHYTFGAFYFLIKVTVIKKNNNNLAIALYCSVLSLVVEGINNEMFTAWQKMEAM